MAINWILPVRAAQAVLSIVVLGLMAYGKPPTHLPYPPSIHHLHHSRAPTNPPSIIMVVNTLAPILPPGNKLPHLRALMDHPQSHPPPAHLLAQVFSYD